MSLLISLPPEVLEKVLNDLSGTWLVRLWLTGSSSLHQMLGNRGAITSAIFNVSHPSALSSSRWPGMIGNLMRLTSLTIAAGHMRIAHPDRIWRSLSSLKHLRELLMHCDEAEAWMFDFVKGYQPLTTGAPFADSGLSSEEVVLRPIASAFPCLEVLKLRTERPFIKPKHIAQLPPSLRTLWLDSSPIAGCIDYLAKLPLLSDLAFKSYPYEASAKCPPSITSLVIRGAEHPFPPSFWKDCNLKSISASMSSAPLLELPSTVERLKITSRSGLELNSLDHLPHLKRFQCHSLKSSAMPHFPAGLESLTLMAHYRMILGTNASPLPASLTSLSLHAEDQVDIIPHIKGLKNLVSLEISNPHNYPMDALIGLPDGLKTLKFRYSAQEDLSPIVKKLPKGLETFQVNAGAFLPAASLHHLPRSLTDLYCTLRFPDSECPNLEEALPKTMKSLHLLLSLPHPHIDDLLASLDLSNLAQLKTLGLNVVPYPIWTIKTFSLIPSTLHRLNITCAAIVQGALKAIPQDLVSLNLQFQEEDSSIFEEDLSRLPPKLTSLSITHSSPIDLQKVTLPTSLHSLTFISSDIPHGAFQHVPRTCSLVVHHQADIQPSALIERLKNKPLADPDPRVTGGDLEWAQIK